MIITEKMLEDFFKDCKFRKRLNGNTLRAYEIDIKQFIDFIDMGDINNNDITEYIHYLNTKYDKFKTVKRKIASVKVLFFYLEYIEAIDNSPFRKIKTKIKEPKLLPKIINSSMIDQIFKFLYDEIRQAKSEYKKKISIRNTAIVELLFSTGIRISELCNIKLDDIDLDNGNLIIYGKGSKERNLFIGNQEVIDILRKHYDLNIDLVKEKGYIFLNREGNRLSEQSIRKLLHHIEYKLDLKLHITPHMYRHTFATMLLDNDVDIRYIQKILGHSSISTTEIYTHVSNAKQKEILTLKNPRNNYKKYNE